MNADVERYLDYYLDPSRETDYAVLLNGPWGSGKTHFVKSYLRSREAAKPGSEDTPGHLFASLYGIRNTQAITDQFFAQAHPVLASAPVRIIGTIASRFLNGAAGTDVNDGAENARILQDMILKLKGRALVFDDLERCSMPVVDVMGFINTFVEHEGIKVIVVANEDDIPKDQAEDYSRKKEKLVGKSLRVQSDPAVVFDQFTAKLSDPRVAESAKAAKNSVLTTFEASEKQNFRSMRAVLMDFERLVTSVDPMLIEKKGALETLLNFMMATGLEFRSGNLSGKEMARFPENTRSHSRQRVARQDDLPAFEKIASLEERYTGVDWSDPIVPPASLAQIFETGIVDLKSVNDHLGRHPAIVGYAKTPAWRLLWNWSELPRADFVRARGELVAELEGRKLEHPGIILHAAGILLVLEGFGDHVLGADGDVVAYFEKYVADLVAENRLIPAKGLFDPFGGAYAGLGYGASDSEEFAKIFDRVRSATTSAFDAEMKVKSAGLLEEFAANPQTVASLHQRGEYGQLAGSPILHHIDPEAFAKFSLRDGILDAQVFAALVARYEVERHNRLLTPEYPWIQKVRTAIEAASAEAQQPYRDLLKIRTEYYFDKIWRGLDLDEFAASSTVE